MILRALCALLPRGSLGSLGGWGVPLYIIYVGYNKHTEVQSSLVTQNPLFLFVLPFHEDPEFGYPLRLCAVEAASQTGHFEWSRCGWVLWVTWTNEAVGSSTAVTSHFRSIMEIDIKSTKALTNTFAAYVPRWTKWKPVISIFSSQ